MSGVVVDASVLAKLYFAEEGSDQAEAALRRKRTSLHAPDLLHVEFANIVWKRFRRGEVNAEIAREICNAALEFPIEIHAIGRLTSHALQLAIETNQTVYDSLYLAVAIAENAKLLTADARLVNGLKGGPFEKYVAPLAVS